MTRGTIPGTIPGTVRGILIATTIGTVTDEDGNRVPCVESDFPNP